MGDKGWICIFPEGERICTMQGDTIFAAHQPDTQLCKRVGANCVDLAAANYFVVACHSIFITPNCF